MAAGAAADARGPGAAPSRWPFRYGEWVEGDPMPGPNNNNQTPQQLYAGEPTGGSGRGRAHRAVAPSRLRTALQLGVVIATAGVLVFAVLSANGVF